MKRKTQRMIFVGAGLGIRYRAPFGAFALDLAHPFDAGGASPLQLSCSIGFAEYPLHATPPSLDCQNLVELADRALYHVKETGRDGWAAFLFTPTTPFPALIQRFKHDRGSLLAEDALRLITSRDPLPPDSQAVAVEFKARS